MACTYKYPRVNYDDQVSRLRDSRAAALSAGRLADAAELTRQLDELYAELGSERIASGSRANRGGRR
jgi:hypothetical protein